LHSLLQIGELHTQKFPIWNCPQYTQHTSHFPYLSCSCLTPLTASCWKPAAAASNLFSSSSSLSSWLDSRIEMTQEPKLASCYNLTPTMTPNNISPPEADPPWLGYSKQFPRAPQPASIQNAPKRNSLSSSRNWSGGKTRSTHHHHQSNKVLQFRQKNTKCCVETKECGYNSNQRWQIDKKKKKKICEHVEEIQSFPDPFSGNGRASERASVVAGMAPCYPIHTWYLRTLPFEVSSSISRSWLGFSR
jgi:hypothetical protein